MIGIARACRPPVARFDVLYEFELDEICGGYTEAAAIAAGAPAEASEAASPSACDDVAPEGHIPEAPKTERTPAPPVLTAEQEIERIVSGLLATPEGRATLARMVRRVGNGFYDVTLRMRNGATRVQRVWLYEGPPL